ncbi:MAG: hypothetical protein ABUK01_06710 [Leptospirales bacterium]
MEYQLFETPKSGLPDDKNEDSVLVKKISSNQALITMSDGASTGVFSRNWSDHITGFFDTAFLDSSEDFLNGLQSLRTSFQPEITRPSAQRKFLLEGSYATVLASFVEKVTGLFSSRFKINNYAVGDVCLFIFNKTGELKQLFPYKESADFGNIPDLVRSSEKHQAKTPFSLRHDKFTASLDDTIVYATDAFAEFLLKQDEEHKLGHKILERVRMCKNNQQFRRLMDYYRTKGGMHNDDVTICILEAKK